MERLECTTFSAQCDYGPKNEQIKIKNIFTRIFKDITTRLFKPVLYGTAPSLIGRLFNIHPNIDMDRIKQAQESLKFIGGESIKIKTTDGDLLNGLHINANNFKSVIDTYFTLSEKENADGTISQRLLLKEEFYDIEQGNLLGVPCQYQTTKPEVEQALNKILSLLSLVSQKEGTVAENPLTRGLVIDIGIKPSDLTEDRNADGPNPTVILVPGSGMLYPGYKSLIASYLIRGMDVTLFDPRGCHQSQGNPTDDKTKLDLEAVYQYVQQEHGVKNSDILIHGHCLGGGAGSDLASRRKGVNLLLDRSFAESRDLVQGFVPFLSGLIYRILPWVNHYNNAKNLETVTGHIAIVMDESDSLISEDQIEKLINHLPDSEKGQHMRLIDSGIGHTGVWSETERTKPQFEEFLEQTHLRRRLF